MPTARTDDLPPLDFAARRRLVAQACTDQGLDALYVTDAADLAWATGFTGSNGALLIAADGRSTFTTDHRYAGRITPTDDLDVVIDRDLFAMVAATADDAGRVGFDPAAVSHARALTWLERAPSAMVARGGIVTGLRVVKDSGEVARLARACEVTVAAWEAVVVGSLADGSLVGRTEREVATAIERCMVDLGADDVAFPSIVAAGPNGAVPHHEPGDRPIGPGELLTVDIGAKVDGYHADFTRTSATSHDLADELATLHDLVARAQQAGIAAMVVGAPVVGVDAAAREVIAQAGHGADFVHGVGHGVGLAIHEDPMIALAGEVEVAAGMVMTVEPGVYILGTGGVRIEDTVLAGDDGPRILTVASSSLHPTTG